MHKNHFKNVKIISFLLRCFVNRFVLSIRNTQNCKCIKNQFLIQEEKEIMANDSIIAAFFSVGTLQFCSAEIRILL